MKRPPGLWILLISAGVLFLSLQDVYGIRATALIFAKSTTSTTTVSPEIEENNNATSISSNTTEKIINNGTDGTNNNNSTTPTLTGNPQLDYIYDPNLPKELNGYNLSDYPFYERVPDEEIAFKCDGLHDGFYASIPHKCQVYHHCLFGTRFDFLCANYTAFDQKTFICHFASEVDCPNSKKYWHRNDALYQTQSTTTTAPVNLRAAIYTTASPEGAAAAADPITPISAPRRPSSAGGGARRPYRPSGRRRRPYDYYEDEYYYDDEYYDERPRARPKRPRPRPRPLYDDDYAEYEDERVVEARRPNNNNGGRRRRPYQQRPLNKERRNKPSDNVDQTHDDAESDDDHVVAGNNRRKPSSTVADEEIDRKPTASERNQSRKNNRRPIIYDDYAVDEEAQRLPDEDRNYDQKSTRKHANNPLHGKEESSSDSDDGRPIIKSSTGTIYDRPRIAPRINRPVPKNAADKFSYNKKTGSKSASSSSSSSSSTTTIAAVEEYAEEDYEESQVKPATNKHQATSSSSSRSNLGNNKFRKDATKSQRGKISHQLPEEEEEEIIAAEVVTTSTNKPKHIPLRNRFRPSSAKKKPPPPQVVVVEELEEDYLEEEDSRSKLLLTSTTTVKTTISTTTTTTETPPKKEPVMRIIKRPFLPSRGGSPYTARGLQPVGLKAVDKLIPETEVQESRVEKQQQQQVPLEEQDYIEEELPIQQEDQLQKERRPSSTFKSSPVLIKIPPSSEAQELINLEPSSRHKHHHQQNFQSKVVVQSSPPRTTHRPKILEKNPLDLNEYDVTLNEAINPTLPNLPIRSFPTGFSSSGGEYGYSTFTRPRYVLEPIIGPNQNYVYPNKRSQQRYEAIPQQFNNFNNNNRGSTLYRSSPQNNGQTQAVYAGY